MAGQDRGRAPELFGEHRAGHQVWPGHPTEAEQVVGAGAGGIAVAIGGADQKAAFAHAPVAPAAEQRGKLLASHRRAPLVEEHFAKRSGDGVGNSAAGVGQLGVAERPGDPLGIAVDQLGLGRAGDLTAGDHMKEHRFTPAVEAGNLARLTGARDAAEHPRTTNRTGSRRLRRRRLPLGPASGRAGRSVEAPHPFEVVEAAHFRAEKVNDHAARVDQHPVRCRQSLDPRIAEAALFQALAELLRHGRDLPCRAAGRDHHVIGDGGFAVEVDGHGLLSLVVIQGLQNESEKRVVAGDHRGGRRAGRNRLQMCLWHLGVVCSFQDRTGAYDLPEMGSRCVAFNRVPGNRLVQVEGPAGTHCDDPGKRRCVTASREGPLPVLRAQSGSAWRIAVADRASGSNRNVTSAGALHLSGWRKLGRGLRNRPSQAIAGLARAASS